MNQIEQLMYNTRRFLTLVAASVLGLLLIEGATYAQTVTQKKTIQKQSTITPAETTQTQLDGMTVTDTSRAAIRPYHINIPEADLVDLRRRILATRWPDRRRSLINPRACNWRSSRHSQAIGEQLTTGGRPRRS